MFMHIFHLMARNCGWLSAAEFLFQISKVVQVGFAGDGLAAASG
jgi:hypothetical protein